MDSADNSDLAMVPDYRNHPGFDATAERNRQLLTGALDQIEAGNFERFWDIFDPDVTFYEASCLPYGGAHRGLEATQRAYAQLSATFSEMKSVMEAVLASRDLCILYQTITFRTAEAGVAASFPVCEVFRFRDGKVIEWRACYFDACLMAQAING
ncbi:MAG: nuclear transport factor 2 family protein [Sphingomonadales bacterium]|nr:nuclear transport factor 2 family protein [Sphingomonadales bacterium]